MALTRIGVAKSMAGLAQLNHLETLTLFISGNGMAAHRAAHQQQQYQRSHILAWHM